jgi:transposase InsO family protein
LSKEFPYLGPVPLSELLKDKHGLSLHQSTIYRILARCTDRYEPGGRKRWKKDPVLYCLEEPGKEVQMDACYPFGRARDIAVFDAVDDCSRYVCADVFAGEDLPSAKAFIRKLVRTSPFRIQSIRLDNRFKGPTLKKFCRYYGIHPIFNEPYHPEQNGKIERYHKTYKREAVWRTMSFEDSIQTLRYKTALWARHYNFNRRHGGYGMNRMAPAEKLAAIYLSKTMTNPQPVTGSLQQYILRPGFDSMVYFRQYAAHTARVFHRMCLSVAACGDRVRIFIVHGHSVPLAPERDGGVSVGGHQRNGACPAVLALLSN